VFTCEAVDLDFLTTAPKRLGATITVNRPPGEVFAAFAHDPANWGTPAFHAWVEDYHFEPDGDGGTLLRVAIGSKPRLAFKLAAPLLPRALPLVLSRAGHNLEMS
jgi:hypothetical protein